MKAKANALTALCLIMTLLFTGCGSAAPAITKPPVDGRPETASAWIPYWDWEDAVAEIGCMGEHLHAVVIFAAVFDGETDKLLLPDGIQQAIEQARAACPGQKDLYLSVVNDVRQADGTYLSKNTALLKRLFRDAASADRHIEELISICSQSGADGLEIDYEAIKDDAELWASFCGFVSKLYARTEKEQLKLRVVLGAYDYKYAEFPSGPEYVVMCYNLYGTHSGAGPKADLDFLRQTVQNSAALPGKATIALACGGFDWGEKCRAVTETDAQRLIEEHKVTEIERDDASKALHFAYSSGGVRHEVWFADGETLADWMSAVGACGMDSVSLWRLGGNRDKSLIAAFG